MAKQIIGIDIDDVLSASAESFVAFSNQRWGTNLEVKDYSEHWAELWQVDMEEAERRANIFHESGAIRNYGHFDGALPVLSELSKHYNLVAITSRRRSIEDHTRQWMSEHYKGIFTAIEFAGIFDGPLDLSMLHKTKADLFTSNRVTYVIDDQLKHCLAAAKLGIESILFGNYSWNQATDLPTKVFRCKDWAEVQKYFDGKY